MDLPEGKTRQTLQGSRNQLNKREETGKPNLNGKLSSLDDAEGNPVASPSPFLSVIIPAYNEEKRLPETLKTVLEFFEAQDYPVEVIVVDDGSEDNTTAIVQRLMSERSKEAQSKNPVACELKLIKSEHRGKGFSVRRGMLAGKGQYLLFSDADLSTPISDVEKLLFWLEQGYDVAVGSREGKEAHRYNEPFYRHLMGRVFNLMVRILTQTGLEDTQCGFKALRFNACQSLFQSLKLYGDGSNTVKGPMVTGFDVELLFLARKYGYKIKEVPVEWYHVRGSKVNPLKDSVRMARDIFKVRLNDLRGLYKK